MGKRKFRVVIVDENPVCRRGLRDLLHEDGRFEVIGEADHSKAAVKSILEHEPDAAVLDSLPGNGSLEVFGFLKGRDCRTHFVVLAHQKDESHFNHAISLGVKGYVLKRNPTGEILDCIATVAAGGAYVCPALTDFLLRRHNRAASLARRQAGLGGLTAAEKHVLKRIAHGKTSRQIAIECGVSPRTVDSHRAHIAEKLELRGSNCLLHFALEHRDELSHLH